VVYVTTVKCGATVRRTLRKIRKPSKALRSHRVSENLIRLFIARSPSTGLS
jgi:hypothetical protein